MSSKAQQQRGKDTGSQSQKDKAWAGARPVKTPESNRVPFREERPTVLIVDDSRDIREYLSRLLEKQFSITTAADGRACLNKASAEPPNCIVTDINMPHLNGIDTIKCLRRDPRLTHIPIIAMSAYGNWAVAKALEAGATIVMLKPLEPDDVIQNIQKLVNEIGIKE
jgi:CheY-like chemotaxis protein